MDVHLRAFGSRATPVASGKPASKETVVKNVMEGDSQKSQLVVPPFNLRTLLMSSVVIAILGVVAYKLYAKK